MSPSRMSTTAEQTADYELDRRPTIVIFRLLLRALDAANSPTTSSVHFFLAAWRRDLQKKIASTLANDSFYCSF